MFHLYHHNDLERLAELLAALRQNAQTGPFTADTVLVPNRGLGRWLKIQLAESEGIAANIDVRLPAEWLWQQIRDSSPNAPETDHFGADTLCWHLYMALPRMADDIPRVADYLGTPVDEVRRYQLAAQLANVFDQYLVFRADMLERWTRGEMPEQAPDAWQARVWRWLTADNRLGTNHRARLLRDFVHNLRENTGLQNRLRQQLDGPVYCFGLATLPPDHLRLLYAIAEHADIHFLLPNPSAAYWGETLRHLPLTVPDDDEPPPGEIGIENNHPLLGSLGRMARDTLRVIYSDEFAGMIEPELGDPMAYARPGRDTLLHRIQSDIVTLDTNKAPRHALDDGDVSLELHACHSPLREVQVLQDQLLDRLAANDRQRAAKPDDPPEQLTPRDIIVMLPDVATYAPAIEAVFGGAGADRHLPWNLADRAQVGAHPVMACVTDLLALPLWRWQASQLLSLLSTPAVMRRFDLDEGDLATITHWVDRAGIRWGRDRTHRQSLAAGVFEQNSWQFGMDRLLLGVMQSDENTLVDGVAPWSDLEGGATAALGKLWRFEQTLADLADRMAEPATPVDWQTRLNALLDALLQPAADDAGEQHTIDNLRRIFAQFEAAEAATSQRPLSDDRTLSWQAVRDRLRAALDQSGERQPFPAGGITFCGMVPLRAVPFRVVCILGLNDDAFPRQDKNRSFNVMYRQPRLGDRNIRDDDRLLFLQALTAARDSLYLSYIGQDIHSGETRPPSPLIGELLSFIERHYLLDAHQKLIHQQPMQPFSARYFLPGDDDSADSRVFTYAHDWRDATVATLGDKRTADNWLDGSRAPLPEPIRTVDLADLIRFYRDPPKAFFEGRLGLRLDPEDDDMPSDDEPISLIPLTQARLRRRLFHQAIDHDHTLPDTPSAQERARGEWPPPPRANAPYAHQADIANRLLAVHRCWQVDPNRDTVSIDLTLDGVRLTGRVSDIGSSAMTRMTTSRLKTRTMLRHWIEYLAVVASGHDIPLQLVGLHPDSKNDNLVARSGRVAPEQAHERLRDLIRHYLIGQQQPLAFHPDMADEYKSVQNKAFSNMWQRFSSSHRHPHHLVDDPYFSLLLGDDDAPMGTADDNPFLAALDAITEPMQRTMTETDLPDADAGEA